MTKWLILAIVGLGFILRVSFLGQFPSGFTPDEASFGYDAYSILKTGADQWGHKLPLVFESFGDFKAPLYGYLDIPFVALFGLNKVAVRLPNAILGSLAVLATYLLATKLFNKKIGLVTAFLFAISPWHIMLSRGAFEANLTTFFLPMGLYFLLETKYLVGALFLGLNLFSYHTAKFVTPMVTLIFTFLYWKEIALDFKDKKISLMIGILVLGLFGLLTVYTFFIGGGSRVSERIITQGATEASFVDKTRVATVIGDNLARLFHNKIQITAKRFTENYFSYFSPQFLFTNGPREATYGMIPGRGVLFWLALPLLVVVRKLFYSNKKSSDDSKYKKSLLLLGVWILVSPIPASLASGVGFSANRVAAMMPAIDIIIGLGGYIIFEYVRRNKILLYSLVGVIILSLGLFIEDYFIESPIKSAPAMLYGNLEVARYLKDNVSDSQVVIVDKSLSEPQIYFAFEQQMDPKLYQTATKTWLYKEDGIPWVDQMGEYKLGNLTFKDISKADIKPGNILVGKPSDFDFEVKPEKVIYYPSHEVALEVVRL